MTTVLATVVATLGWGLVPVPASAAKPALQGAMVVSASLDPFGDAADFDVLLVDPIGGKRLRQVTTDTGRDWFPDLSPDRSTIIWQSDRTGKFELYRIPASATEDEQPAVALTATDGAGESTVPSYSPDGTQIAFVSTRSAAPHLYVMRADGSDVRQVGAYIAHDASRPSWSADGTQIMFAGAATADATQLDIVVADVASGETRAVVATPDDESEPAWSPDGAMILFFRDGHVWAMSATGQNARQMTRSGMTADGEYQPTWAPDGRRFAYVSSNLRTSDIYVADANGKHAKPVVRGNFAAEAPAWS